MLRIDKVIKPWKESRGTERPHQSLRPVERDNVSDQERRCGNGASVSPVSITRAWTRRSQEYAVKRLEAALKSFGPGFHVYQYLFKSNRPEIPFANYDDPVVQTEVNHRREFFESKRDNLYQIEIFYCILLGLHRRRQALVRPCSPRSAIQRAHSTS